MKTVRPPHEFLGRISGKVEWTCGYCGTLNVDRLDMFKWKVRCRGQECGRKRYFEAGKPMPELLFPTENGGVMNKFHIWRAIMRTPKKAKLDLHFSAHSFRHTFASQLLQLGESPAYVQRQLGHSSIKMTVDTYGKWLPSGNRAAVDKLDQEAPEVAVQEGAK
jgi:integrase